MKKVIIGAISICFISSLVFAKDCKKLYNDKSFKVKIAKNKSFKKKVMQCVDNEYTPLMCVIADYQYSGKNGFSKNRKKGYKLAQKAIEVSNATGSDAEICRLSIHMWSF